MTTQTSSENKIHWLALRPKWALPTRPPRTMPGNHLLIGSPRQGTHLPPGTHLRDHPGQIKEETPLNPHNVKPHPLEIIAPLNFQKLAFRASRTRMLVGDGEKRFIASNSNTKYYLSDPVYRPKRSSKRLHPEGVVWPLEIHSVEPRWSRYCYAKTTAWWDLCNRSNSSSRSSSSIEILLVVVIPQTELAPGCSYLFST